MNPTVEFGLELQMLRDQLGEAIIEGRLSDIEEGFRTYLRLVDTVLVHFRALEQLGETPPAAMFNVYGSEMQWIEDAIDTFIEQGSRTRDPEVLKRVLGLIVDLTHLSFGRRERSAFVAALNRLVWLWRASSEYLEGGQWESLRRHLLLSLQNLMDYTLGRELGQSGLDDLVDRFHFLTKAFTTFSDILRLCIDRNEFTDFEAAAEYLGDALHFGLDQLHDAVTSSADRVDVHDIRVRLLALPDVLTLGIHAWILLRTRGGRMSSEEATKFIDALLRRHEDRLPLWAGYQLARESDLESLFHWHFWEMELRGNRAGFITFGGFIDEAYVRQLMREGVDGLPRPEVMPQGEAIDSRYTFERLQRVADETLTASPSMDETLVGQRDLVVQRLKELEAMAERLEDEELISQELDLDKIQRFIGALQTTWTNGGVLRRLCGDLDIDQSPPPADLFPLGINRLVPKYYFVDSRVHADPASLGEEFANAMVRGETSLILGPLIGGVDQIACRYDDFLEKLRSQIESLRNSRYEPVVLISNSWRMVGALRDELSTYLHPGTQLSDAPRFEEAPVLYEYLDERDLCLVADFQRLMRLRFFEPIRVRPNDELYEQRRLLIGMEAIDEARARELIEGNQGFLTRDGDTLPIEEAVRELKKDVNIRIFEKLQVEVADADAGRLIRLEEDLKDSA